jgi:hypothetical protein
MYIMRKNGQLSMNEVMLYSCVNDWHTRPGLLALAKKYGCDANETEFPRENKHGKIQKYKNRGGSTTTRLGQVLDKLNGLKPDSKPFWKLASRKSTTSVWSRGKATKKLYNEYKFQMCRPIKL